VELHNVSGSQVHIEQHYYTMTLWLVVNASNLIFPTFQLQHLLDRTRPQKTERNSNRDFLYETEPKLNRKR
jgi:hypothetical protein